PNAVVSGSARDRSPLSPPRGEGRQGAEGAQRNVEQRKPPSPMTDLDQKQLGKTLWNIADTLRGAMNADDFRDYMLSFLFLRYLSNNYEEAKKELRADCPDR